MKSCTVILFALLPAAFASAGEPASRFGIALFDPPAGWSMAEKDGRRIYTSPDRTVSISISPSRPHSGKVATAAEKILEEAKVKADFREENRQAGGKHDASGGWWSAVTYSYADPDRPGHFLYDWAVVLAAAKRAITVTTTSTSTAAFQEHGVAASTLVNGLRLTTAIQLEPGEPPLTRFMVDETGDFLEWLLQSPLTDGQRATVEEEMRKSWKADNRKDIDDVRELLEGREKLAEMKPGEREVVRQAVLDEAIKGWREDKESPAAQMALSIHDAANKPIAAGDPPLTRQQVDAFTEFIYFAAGQTAGVKASPKDDVKKKMAEDVAAKYPNIPEEGRRTFGKMPLAWAAIRMLWPDMAEAEKKGYVDGWKASAELTALGKELGKEAQAKASSDFAANAARLQMQQQHFQMMSNIMRMQHETSMVIIGNMGGNTRYEYRW